MPPVGPTLLGSCVASASYGIADAFNFISV
jgi:hypothetical protein